MVSRELRELAEYLATYQPIVFPALHPDEAGKYQQNLLIKIDPAQWPRSELVEVLKDLPPAFVVTVDPEHIF